MKFFSEDIPLVKSSGYFVLFCDDSKQKTYEDGVRKKSIRFYNWEKRNEDKILSSYRKIPEKKEMIIIAFIKTNTSENKKSF